MLSWRYKRFGACEFCQDSKTPLSTFQHFPFFPAVTPPLFCRRCQQRIERALADGDDLIDWIREKRRR